MSKEFTSADAVILAGGKGARMGRLTKNKQKCLMPIDDRPILGHVLNSLSQAFGSATITICVSYRAKDVIDYVNKNRPTGLTINYVSDVGNSRSADIYRALGTKVQQPLVVTAGDIYIKPDAYIKALEQILRVGVLASTIFSSKLDEIDTHAVGKIKDNSVMEYSYPPPPQENLDEDHLREINIFGLNERFYGYIQYYPKIGKISELLYQATVDQEHVAGDLYQGPWIHLGYPEDLRKSMM